MGIFNTLFSGTNTVEKGVDAAINAGDKLALTKEERLDYHLLFLEKYEAFKVAQRFLMLIVGIPYVLIHVIVSILYLASSAFIDPVSCLQGCGAESLQNAALTVGRLNQDTLGDLFYLIGGFYFGGGLLEGGIRAWRQRKDKQGEQGS